MLVTKLYARYFIVSKQNYKVGKKGGWGSRHAHIMRFIATKIFWYGIKNVPVATRAAQTHAIYLTNMSF